MTIQELISENLFSIVMILITGGIGYLNLNFRVKKLEADVVKNEADRKAAEREVLEEVTSMKKPLQQIAIRLEVLSISFKYMSDKTEDTNEELKDLKKKLMK